MAPSGGGGGRKRTGRSSSPPPPTLPPSAPPLSFADFSSAEDTAPDQRQPSLSFPVVCVGASAGGLEAFTQLLAATPADTGMAFVLVSHLSPSHASHLAEILSRATRMPVDEVTAESTM